MSDLIDRQAAINAICEDGTWLERQGCTEITMAERKQRDADILSALSSFSRDHENDHTAEFSKMVAQPEPCEGDPRADVYYLAEKIGIHRLYALVVELRGEPESCGDMVSRQAAIDGKISIQRSNGLEVYFDEAVPVEYLKSLPSAQPERKCLNCGRTANNGGWYADGKTRCPIEEHYALPKDGYCHLWEKRNVTDDDYPERREE